MDYYASLFASKVSGGGGSDVTVEPLSVTENGTYQEEGKAYSPVSVNVPVGWTSDGIAQNLEPNGAVTLSVDSIGVRAFAGKPITSVTGNAVTSIGHSAFVGCSSLASVVLPNITALDQFTFEGCSVLKTLHLPNVASSNTYNYRNSGIETLVLPKISRVTGWQTFSEAKALKTVDILGFDFYRQTFNGCIAMNVLIIRADTVISLTNTDVFGNTPFASGKSGGTLYVPSSLISSYQSATNWSTILGYENNQIKAIEGSIYENAYADGTPIS